MSAYLYGFGDPCLPTRSAVAPSGSLWLHEIKHDGYRLMVRRTSSGVRIKTRRGYDWTDRFRAIVDAASTLRATSFVLDGEGVILRTDGTSDFDRLLSRRHDGEVQLLGFDLLELDGLDVRTWPLERRKIALHACCVGRATASSWSSTSRRATAPPSSRTPASSGWKASSRSGATSRIGTGAAASG